MEITTEVIKSFREQYISYIAPGEWPDRVLTQYLCDADMETGGSGWGAYESKCDNFKRRGMFLYAAHALSLDFPSGRKSGSVDSTAKNPVASKSVGDESVSYATGAPDGAADSGNAWLSSTSFGQQFMRLRRRAGMGAIAV